MSTQEDVPQRRMCGAQVVHERLLRTDPAYRAARVQSENRAWEAAMRRGVVARPGITVIPVVVHVVFNSAAENISDEQIHSQITVLNQDFRSTNPDASNTPSVFQPLVADARIEFELATTDPSGNPTTGITRTETTVTAFGDDDGVKSASTGGADAWPRDKYLNMWVCSLTGGLLGYAQFPGGPEATDGVVIRHSAFGNTGTAAAPFDLGRTTTHEIGHWLNLRHIWGDDGNGCNGDDFVADTPNQASENTGMPSFPHVSCDNDPNGDLFMNYMDYTDDAGMFMFTHGQVTRMHAALDGDRSGLGRPKAGPKFKVADDIPKLKFRDDGPKLKFVDDGVTLKFRDDGGGPKVKFVDDPGTSPAIDLGKMPGLDKPPADLPKGPADVPGPMPFVLATPHHSTAWAGSVAGGQTALASYAGRLREYEQVLAQYAQADAAGQLTAQDVAAGDQLYSEYASLAAEYRRVVGG